MGELSSLKTPSKEELVKKTHELAKKSENVYFDYSHLKDRMRERNISIQQILDVLKHGKWDHGPTLDPYGCLRIRLKRCTAGQTVCVVVIVKDTHLEVVTVFKKEEKT